MTQATAELRPDLFHPPAPFQGVLPAAAQFAALPVDSVADALVKAASFSDGIPQPGRGQTAHRWWALASVAAANVTAARVLEPHLDALAILAEADISAADLDPIAANPASTWGVYAAEGKGVAVTAEARGSGWVLNGRKVWCSLADSVSHGLVTAHTTDGNRRLFAIDLSSDEVTTNPEQWFARGLPQVTSGPIDLKDAQAIPVGADNWYLTRPGFAWGGIGVAACWWGGAVGLARRLVDRLRETPGQDPISEMHLGAIDVQLSACRQTFTAAAAEVDRGSADVVLVERVRSQVADAVEQVLTRLNHTLGPTPLAFDDWYAGQFAGLELYVRQHHGEKDLARLGGAILRTSNSQGGDYPW